MSIVAWDTSTILGVQIESVVLFLIRQEVLLSEYSGRYCPTCYCPVCESGDETTVANIKAVLEQPYDAVSRKTGVVVPVKRFLVAARQFIDSAIQLRQ